MKNKNIFFLVGDMKHPGGVEKVSSLLAKEFSNSKANVTVFSLYSRENQEPDDPQINVVHLDFIPPDIETLLWKKIKRLVANGLMLRRRISSESGTFIFQGFYSSVYLPFLNLKGAQVVVCEHNTFNAPGKLSRFVRRILYKTYAPDVIVLTDSDKAQFQRIGVKSVKISNPCPYPITPTSKDVSRNRLVSLGRFTSQKRFPLMIQLCAEVLKKHPTWQLCIQGQGEELEEMKVEIIKSGLLTQITLLPQGNPSELYESGDIFLMTSAFEGQPMTLIESMAFGIPSVCFDCSPGLSEVVKHGENGFLVPMNDRKTFIDKVSELIENPELRKRFGDGAKITAKKFSMPLVISEWEKIIK